jgi:hypothetical protein
VLLSIKNRVRASSRRVARKNNITHSTVLRILKKMMSFKTQKKIWPKSDCDGFWTDDVENTPDAAELKVLVWCPISEAGISRPFIELIKGQAVDTDVYITKCLPKMVKFIKKHKWRNNLLARFGIVPFCKENVGMVRPEKHQNSV